MFCIQTFIVLLISSLPSCLISTNISYEDLEEIDGVCPLLDTCTSHRSSDSLDKYTCHCDSICSKLRTCCVDSLYRDIKLPGKRPICRSVNDEYEHFYFMEDSCLSSHNTDEIMETLCKEEPSEQDNLIPFIPVTSLSTNVTYKNYYCFKCNEDTKDFMYWSVKVNANSSSNGIKAEDVALTYDTTDRTWKAPVGDRGNSIPVTLFFAVPSRIQSVPKICVPNVVSTCSGNWTEQDVKRKCRKYTSFVYIVKNDVNIRYRNPHCALCNFENLQKMGCGYLISQRTRNKQFSFSIMMDFIPWEENKPRCDGKTMWDPYSKICRRVTCLNRKHVVRDGKCVPP